ncbi:MAG: hypothetical protein V4772_18725 [Pseudomonadota bacterium]
MKKLFCLWFVVFGFLTGCAPKLADADIAAVLAQNLPENLRGKATVESVQSEIASSGDELQIKFKSNLKLTEALFEKTEFDAAAQAAGFDTSSYQAIDKGMGGLSAAARDSLSPAAKQATARPLMIRETAAAGSLGEWYGSFRAKKFVDKWVASDFKTDIAPKFVGLPRASFAASAIDSAASKAWFADIQTQQKVLLEKIANSGHLDKKDAEIASVKENARRELLQKEANLAAAKENANRQLAQKEADIARARENARREHEARAAQAAAGRNNQPPANVRQMPVSVKFRQAFNGGGVLVMQLQANQDMKVRVHVTRGPQKNTTVVSLQAGRLHEFGQAEGWGFRSGDVVVLANRLYDPINFTVR